MNIWRAIKRAGRAGVTAARRELVATWRSLRYDLRHRTRPAGGTAGIDDTGPEAGGAYEAYARRPGRLRAAAAVGALAVGGAVATYAAVAGGLSALPTNDPDPGDLPAVAAERQAADPPPAGPGWLGTQPAVPSPDRLAPPVLPAVDPDPTGPPPAGTPRAPVPDPAPPATLPDPAPESMPTAGPGSGPAPSPTSSATPTPSPTCACPGKSPSPRQPEGQSGAHETEPPECDDTTDGHQS